MSEYSCFEVWLRFGLPLPSTLTLETRHWMVLGFWGCCRLCLGSLLLLHWGVVLLWFAALVS